MLRVPGNKKSALLCALALAFGGSTAVFPNPAAAEPVTFEIHAGDASDTLKEFARQAKLQTLFDYRLVQNLRTQAVKGDFEADEALRKMLAGTGLRFERINERTVAIRSRGEKQAEAARQDGEIRLVQAAANGAPAKDEPAQQEKSDPRLQEIVVTARKRAERVEDVPLSIGVITADEIERRRLVNAEDYLRGMPGVNQTGQASGQTIVIRGLETSPAAQNFGSGATVATYFGETQTTNSGGLYSDTNVDIKLVDIQRVEVLRGPQGTSFGSSSLGGAVRTIPMAPKLGVFEGKVGSSYSTTSGADADNFSVQAVANIPLISDKLAVRAVAYTFKDGGFYRNVAGSDAAFLATAIVPYGAQDAAVNMASVGDLDHTGARVAALFQATDDLKFTLSYLTQKTEMDGFGLANRDGYTQVLPLVAPEHAIRGSREPAADLRIEILNAVGEYDLHWADVLATYSRVDSGTVQSFPFAAGNFFTPNSVLAVSPHDEYSSEVRLATKFEGAWNFLAGLYYEKLQDDYSRSDIWHGNPATNVFAPGQRSLGHFRDQREKVQKAVFGEISWELLPGLTLTGGGRFYDHKRDYQRDNEGFFFTNTVGGTSFVESHAEVSGSTFRGNLSYKPNESSLVYVDWSQGFRLGNPQAGLPVGRCDLNNDGLVDGTSTPIAATRELQPDSLDSFELGTKLALLDRRIRVAASLFRIDWEGLPFRVLTPNPPVGCGLSYVANASAAKSEGVELETGFQITRAFRADVNASWIRAVLTEDAPGVGGVAGDRLPNSPKFNASVGLQYELDFHDRAVSLRADSIYLGEYYGTLKPIANLRAGDYVKLDLSAQVMVRDDLSVQLFARNVTNEDAFTFRNIANYGPFFGYRLRPRTVGIQLDYAF